MRGPCPPRAHRPGAEAQDTAGIGWEHPECLSHRWLQAQRETLRGEHMVHKAEQDGVVRACRVGSRTSTAS